MFIWTISDAVTAVIFAVFLIVALYVGIATWIRQTRCKHSGGVNETQACDAICRECGKNLGFIGTWREKHRSA